MTQFSKMVTGEGTEKSTKNEKRAYFEFDANFPLSIFLYGDARDQ